MNERDYPDMVELLLPSGGLRSRSDEMHSFRRERSIKQRRGRGSYADGQFYVRFCFADSADADAFRYRFAESD
jgi:hypothetical protein